jgi:hypothetical protein
MPAEVTRYDKIDMGSRPSSHGNSGKEKPETSLAIQEKDGVTNRFICEPVTLYRGLGPNDDFGLGPGPAIFH